MSSTKNILQLDGANEDSTDESLDEEEEEDEENDQKKMKFDSEEEDLEAFEEEEEEDEEIDSDEDVISLNSDDDLPDGWADDDDLLEAYSNILICKWKLVIKSFSYLLYILLFLIQFSLLKD